jgi:hypothetical protein
VQYSLAIIISHWRRPKVPSEPLMILWIELRAASKYKRE